MALVIISEFDNPNTYDDDAYLRASGQLTEALYGVIEAGADADLIAQDVKNALEDA